MRALVRSLLIAREELTDIVPADRWYEWSAVIDTPPFPFAAIRLAGQQTSVTSRSPVRRGRLEVWVYDERGTFVRIDAALREIHEVLDNTFGVSRSDGGRVVCLTQCDWEQDSTELFDENHKGNCRSSAYTMVGSGW